MKRFIDSYGGVVIICGIIGVIGFFFFPVLQYRSGIAHELAGSILDYSGNGNLRHLTMSSFIGMMFQAGGIDEINYLARILGYSSGMSMLLLYCVPLAGSIGVIIAGLSGESGQAGMFVLGLVNGACYILQIITFPEYMSISYRFSFWQYLLIAASVVVLLVGTMRTSSDYTLQQESSSQQVQYSPASDLRKESGEDKQGALIGLNGVYKNAVIPILSGETIAIGRSVSQCNLILQDSSVSRVHCYVRYDRLNNEYLIKDVSKYGVYDEQGDPIARNIEVHLKPGRQFSIGKGEDAFKLQ